MPSPVLPLTESYNSFLLKKIFGGLDNDESDGISVVSPSKTLATII